MIGSLPRQASKKPPQGKPTARSHGAGKIPRLDLENAKARQLLFDLCAAPHQEEPSREEPSREEPGRVPKEAIALNFVYQK
jgi:hypothetical protein